MEVVGAIVESHTAKTAKITAAIFLPNVTTIDAHGIYSNFRWHNNHGRFQPFNLAQ
jgi:hypothetical protein